MKALPSIWKGRCRYLKEIVVPNLVSKLWIISNGKYMLTFIFQDEIKILGCQVFVNPYEEVDELVSMYRWVSARKM